MGVPRHQIGVRTVTTAGRNERTNSGNGREEKGGEREPDDSAHTFKTDTTAYLMNYLRYSRIF